MSILSPAQEMGEAVQGIWHHHLGRVSPGFGVRTGAEVSLLGCAMCDASVRHI